MRFHLLVGKKMFEAVSYHFRSNQRSKTIVISSFLWELDFTQLWELMDKYVQGCCLSVGPGAFWLAHSSSQSGRKVQCKAGRMRTSCNPWGQTVPTCFFHHQEPYWCWWPAGKAGVLCYVCLAQFPKKLKRSNRIWSKWSSYWPVCLLTLTKWEANQHSLWAAIVPGALHWAASFLPFKFCANFSWPTWTWNHTR